MFEDARGASSEETWSDVAFPVGVFQRGVVALDEGSGFVALRLARSTPSDVGMVEMMQATSGGASGTS